MFTSEAPRGLHERGTWCTHTLRLHVARSIIRRLWKFGKENSSRKQIVGAFFFEKIALFPQPTTHHDRGMRSGRNVRDILWRANRVGLISVDERLSTGCSRAAHDRRRLTDIRTSRCLPCVSSADNGRRKGDDDARSRELQRNRRRR